jgi:TP901 family phage tail tape measure protein
MGAGTTLTFEVEVDTRDLEKGLKRVEGRLKQTGRTIGSEFQRGAKDVDTFSKGLATLGGSAKRLSDRLGSIGQQLTIGVTLPIAAAGFAIIKMGSDFESAFTGVRKTVDATESEFAALSKGFREMSKVIPITAIELAGIGEAAGQLGIETENILEFTEVMAKLGVTTNLSAEQAATSLARFANIMGTSQSRFEELGSTIVALGNNFATTEAEIVEFSLRIAGAGKTVGLSEDQIFAFGTALSSVGIRAEAGGTAISRIFLEVEKAVVTSSKELELFAAVSGVAAADFAKAFKEDAALALSGFLTSLGEMQEGGESTILVLEALGLDAIRVSDSIRRLSGAGELLTRAMDTASEAMKKNQALTREAELRFGTFESQLKLIKAVLDDVRVSLFESIKPALVGVVLPAIRATVNALALMADAFAALPSPIRTFTVLMVGLIALIGPLLGLGKLFILLGAKTLFFAARTAIARVVMARFAGSVAGGTTQIGKFLARSKIMKSAMDAGSKATSKMAAGFTQAGQKATVAASNMAQAAKATKAVGTQGVKTVSIFRRFTGVLGRGSKAAFTFIRAFKPFAGALGLIGGIMGRIGAFVFAGPVGWITGLFTLVQLVAKVTGQMKAFNSVTSAFGNLASSVWGFMGSILIVVGQKFASLFILIGRVMGAGGRLAIVIAELTGLMRLWQAVTKAVGIVLNFLASAINNAASFFDKMADKLEGVTASAKGQAFVVQTNLLKAWAELRQKGTEPVRRELDALRKNFDRTGNIEKFQQGLIKVNEALQAAAEGGKEVNPEIARLTAEMLAAEGATTKTKTALEQALETFKKFVAGPKEMVKILKAVTVESGDMGTTIVALGIDLADLEQKMLQAAAAGDMDEAAFLRAALAAGKLAESARNATQALKDFQEAPAKLVAMIIEQEKVTNDLSLALEVLQLSSSTLEEAWRRALKVGDQRSAQFLEQAIAAAKAREKLEELGEATVVMDERFKSLDDGLKAMRDTIPALGKDIDFLKSRGASMAEIAVQLGSQLEAAGEHAREFGIELDPTIKKLIEMAEAAKDTEDAAKQWDDAWSTAMGNIVSDFSKGVADMIFEGKGFSTDIVGIFKQLGKTLLSTVISGIIKPIIAQFSGLGQSIGGILGKMFSGSGSGGGGIFGSLFKGIKGLFGGGDKQKSIFEALDIGGGEKAFSFGKLATSLKSGAGKLAGIAKGAFAQIGKFAASGFLGAATVGLAIAIPILIAIFKKNVFKSGVKEAMRDFGVEIDKGALESFAKARGLSKETFKGIRKDIESSPQFFKEILLPAAKAAGTVEQLIEKFSKLQAFGETFDFSAGVRKAVESGDFTDFNNQFNEVFERSAELKRVLPDFQEKLLVGGKAGLSKGPDPDAVESAAFKEAKVAVGGQQVIEELMKIVEIVGNIFTSVEGLRMIVEAIIQATGDASLIDAIEEIGKMIADGPAGEVVDELEEICDTLEEIKDAVKNGDEVTGPDAADAETAAVTAAAREAAVAALKVIQINPFKGTPFGAQSTNFGEARVVTGEAGGFRALREEMTTIVQRIAELGGTGGAFGSIFGKGKPDSRSEEDLAELAKLSARRLEIAQQIRGAAMKDIAAGRISGDQLFGGRNKPAFDAASLRLVANLREKFGEAAKGFSDTALVQTQISQDRALQFMSPEAISKLDLDLDFIQRLSKITELLDAQAVGVTGSFTTLPAEIVRELNENLQAGEVKDLSLPDIEDAADQVEEIGKGVIDAEDFGALDTPVVTDGVPGSTGGEPLPTPTPGGVLDLLTQIRDRLDEDSAKTQEEEKQDVSLEFNIHSPSEDLARVTREEVIPEIIKILQLGGPLADEVIRVVTVGQQGATNRNRT